MATDIQKINEQVGKQLDNKETLATLVATTFKGLEQVNIKQAMVEGMMRGFTFTDFLEKNIYAIPFGKTYSLVTSIDYARKIGMRSGVIGKSAPKYTMEGEKIVSCAITIKRKVGKTVGEFTAEPYFDEYTTKQNLWVKKPRTMIAKVAEMHALRMACPEEMSQLYVEEEKQKDIVVEAREIDPIDIETYGKKLEACKTLDELRSAFSALPFEVKEKLVELKDHLKTTLK